MSLTSYSLQCSILSYQGSPFLVKITTAATNIAMYVLRRRSYILIFGLVLPYLITSSFLSIPSVPNPFVPMEGTKKTPDKAAICLIVSNEEYYLDEWLDYHLGIGFQHM